MESTLFPASDNDNSVSKWRITSFSAGGFCSETERLRLEEKYWPLVAVTDRFNRKNVSFQLSKNDILHSWLKYKEGFSAELVRSLLREFKLSPNALVLDPFMGSGTTALVSMLNGMNCVGFDILPISQISIKAKSEVLNYNIRELDELISFISYSNLPENYKQETPYISITKDGYPMNNAKEIQYFTDLIDNSAFSTIAKNLFTLCAINCLERVSYSAKDGQYLRWDYRCPKIVLAANIRARQGRKPLVVKLNKGDIPSFKDAILNELQRVVNDIKYIQSTKAIKLANSCNFIEGSALFNLPLLKADSINAVISSPPYCNRYDYTRTYALELAYLGIDDIRIRQLRQDLLSCTVENRSKIEILHDFYSSICRESDFNNICKIIKSCSALTETNEALRQRARNGEINNKGILKMVEGYFTELTFLFYEIYRLCKHGAHVAFVNDNVRYAGEVIPVDFITTQLATLIGFKAEKIYTLHQQKGNSSQQMKKYGRVALRKSITIWNKA